VKQVGHKELQLDLVLHPTILCKFSKFKILFRSTVIIGSIDFYTHGNKLQVVHFLNFKFCFDLSTKSEALFLYTWQ